jgi:hypothetical protein
MRFYRRQSKNWPKSNKTLRTTPAMAAGVTKGLWEIGDIVDVLESMGGHSMRHLDQNAVLRNYDQADKLLQYWKDRNKITREPSGVRKFRAVVIYKSDERSSTKTTNVRMNIVGFGEECMIDIAETPDLTMEQFHLRLKPISKSALTIKRTIRC